MHTCIANQARGKVFGLRSGYPCVLSKQSRARGARIATIQHRAATPIVSSALAGEATRKEENKHETVTVSPRVRGFRNGHDGSTCRSQRGSSGRRTIDPALFIGHRAVAYTQRHHQGLSRKDRECRRRKDQDPTIRKRTTVSRSAGWQGTVAGTGRDGSAG